MTPRITLKPGREVSVQRRHPWLFSGAVARVDGDPQPGALVAVYSADRQFQAWGHYSPRSQIRVRFISWEQQDKPNTPDFWRARLCNAINARAPLLTRSDTNACRLVHAESDGIPGLVIDRYNDTVVVQYLSVGVDVQRDLFADLLMDILHPETLYERSDVDVRHKEGLEPRVGLLRGNMPPAKIEILEHGLRFLVDIYHGHKSGFYLDQRENRQRLRETVSAIVQTGKSPTLLNVFAYTGGFAVYGLAGGASSVVNVDTSTDVLALGQENLACNEMTTTNVEDVEGDAFQVLRDMQQQGRAFDIIVLDPPKFAMSQKNLRKATRGYKDINMQALQLLQPGGYLFTFSCSGAVSADLFQKILFGAALDVGRDAQIVGTMTQGADHPVALTFPEGAYLKGLICRAL